MKLVHTQGMNYQRVTISLPNHLYKDLLSFYGKGKISSVISEAVQKKVLQKKTVPRDAIDNFLALRRTAPKRTISQILGGISKGRV